VTIFSKWAAGCVLALGAALIAPQAAFAAKKPAAKVAQKAAKKKLVAVPVAARKGGTARRTVVIHSTMKKGRRVLHASIVRAEPAVPSFGQMYGLHQTADQLDLKSSVALVLDQDTNEVLFSKNSQAVLPIASLTKLMTALVVTEARLNMAETLTVTDEDIDTEKGSRSRLTVGTQLTREELLHLALMSSENRAAHALGRNHPGGLTVFVAAMNRKAQELGMRDTRYVEPTGLSSANQSSAKDLATLVKAAYAHQNIRDLSTSPEYQVEVGNRQVQFHTTNRLVLNPSWDIGLQKTGYISEAGRCLVMQARMAGRKLIMVFLDSAGKYSRLGDAERVRKWMLDGGVKVAS